MGTHLYGTLTATPTMIQLQARYAQSAWESLIQLNRTNQETDKAQALVLLAHSFIILGLEAPAQLYLLKACKTIEKAKLRFFSEHGPPARLSEKVREEVSILSQVIYLENYFYLTLGGSPPVKTTAIERVFKLELQVRAARPSFRRRARN